MKLFVRPFSFSFDLQGNRLYNVGTLVPTPMVGTIIDFSDTVDNLQTITVAVATTFTTTNLAPGRSKELLITSGLIAALTFPSGWIWYGNKLGLTIAAKEIRLRLRAHGTTDKEVRAEFVAQV
jgi:type IV secretory pathway TrbD component